MRDCPLQEPLKVRLERLSERRDFIDDRDGACAHNGSGNEATRLKPAQTLRQRLLGDARERFAQGVEPKRL